MKIEHHNKLFGTVEVDETYIGGVKRGIRRRYVGNKTAVMAMVERGGDVRSQVVEKVTGAMFGKLLKQHVAKSLHLNTDESPRARTAAAVPKIVGKRLMLRRPLGRA